MNRAACTVVATTFVACGFSMNLSTTDAPDAPEDVPDAGPCTEMSATCAAPTKLRTCAGAGAVAVDTECNWGCDDQGTPHCLELVPAGGAVMTQDLQPAALADVHITAATVIDGNMGEITGGFTRAMGTGVKNGVELITRNDVRVFRVNSLRISAEVALEGDHPIAIVANGPIIIEDIVDGRGAPPCSGMMGRVAGPGGFDGGAAKTSAMGSGAGAGSSTNKHGGGGGGAAAVGGRSGALVAGGEPFGDPQITVLVGGGGGGGGAGGGGAGPGAGGGAAIQLTSNTSIEIRAAGGINAGGCGGNPGGGGTNDAGGGGGAGGTILLEAPTIAIAGALAVNGGGGGTHIGKGADGRLDRMAALGGLPIDQADGVGGSGAAGSTYVGGEGVGGTFAAGGGAIGRIRLVTRQGDPMIDAGAIMSPALDDADSPATSVAAPLQ